MDYMERNQIRFSAVEENRTDVVSHALIG